VVAAPCCAGTIERSFGNPEPQSPIDKKAPAHRGYNGGGMPAYALRADREGARNCPRGLQVLVLPHKHICELIVSERTGKPIGLDTLAKAFFS
jgi:hypothetical protein